MLICVEFSGHKPNKTKNIKYFALTVPVFNYVHVGHLQQIQILEISYSNY